ncbi:MAG: histidine kinase [Pseudomonadota bacterium]|nr:histidine kinase [Pseudomonadota bacterium]
MHPESKNSYQYFLPNFCAVAQVFLAVLLTELLAFIWVLVPLGRNHYLLDYVQQNLFTQLAMTSLFLQWITLLVVGLLCWVRKTKLVFDTHFSEGLFGALLILTITILVSELAWQLNEYSLVWELNLTDDHHLWRYFSMAVLIGVLLVTIVPYHLTLSTRLNSLLLLIVLAWLVCEAIVWFDNSSRQEMMAHNLFLLRNLSISGLISAITLRYFYIQYRWKIDTEAFANAKLQALQARIHPHFLFNSMNTIASLIRLHPDKAEHAVEALSDLFRASFSTEKLITLGEELTLCREYIHIEQLRFNERLTVVWDLDTLPKDALIPPLCLQPLLENAIYYGIQALPAGGMIQVKGSLNGQWIQLCIENPLAEVIPKHHGHQIAQNNIAQRLRFCYGHQAQFSVVQHHQCYRVNLSFPYWNQYNENTYR